MKNYKKPKIEIIESVCDEIISCSGLVRTPGIKHMLETLDSYEKGDGHTYGE